MTNELIPDMQPHADTPELSEPPRPTDLACAHRWWLTVLGATSTGFSTAFFSSDWCCTAVGMGLLGAIIAKIEQRLMSMAWARPYCGRLGLRAAYTMFFGLAVGLLFLLDRPGVFEMAFAAKPPPGLRELRLKRHYAGGPGDDAILVSFLADKSTLDKLLAAGPFREDSDITEYAPGERKPWQSVWNAVFSNFAEVFGGKEWLSIQPMKSPKAYTYGKGHRHTTVLWDEATGRAYALSIGG